MKSLEEFAKHPIDPVDPELFLWCQGIYYAAASLSMPVENPGAKPAFEHDGQTYAFSDVPENRGMMAVMKEMRERGLTDDQKMAMSWRLMHFGEIFRHKEKLKDFIKDGDNPGESAVSEALIKACATARMRVSKKKSSFDINDLLRIAHELTAAEEQAESGSKL